MVGASLEERDRRWLNIRRALEQSGLQGLLVVSDAQLERRGSVRYVSNVGGTGGTLMYRYVLFPLEGQPTAINLRGDPGEWIKDNRKLPLRGGWVPESEPYAPVIAETIKELKIEKGNIGIEGDFIPAPVYQRLVKELPKASFKQSNIIHELKMVKSPEELKIVEKGVEMVDKAWETCGEIAGTGKTWNEISSEACKAMYDMGMEDIGGFPLPRSTSMIKRGDIFQFYPEPQAPGGYWIQFGRLISFGEPNKELQDAWKLTMEAQKRGADKLRPGNTGADVMKAINGTLKGTKYTEERRGSGHGVGLDLLERPFISLDDETVLKPGMIVAIHTIFSGGASVPLRFVASWNIHGDMFRVTEDEPQKLSKIAPEIKVI